MLLFCSCLHTSPAARDASFREIQVHEASIARSQAELAGLPACGAEAAREAETLCGAGRALCALSDELDDQDAARRCGLARASCASTREHRHSQCATPAP